MMNDEWQSTVFFGVETTDEMNENESVDDLREEREGKWSDEVKRGPPI